MTGYINIDVCDPVSMFKGFLEGLSFVERMIYDKVCRIGYTVGVRIFSMQKWLKLLSVRLL
ncbi:hypothetical protein ES705_37765 [subsurface metagenome]